MTRYWLFLAMIIVMSADIARAAESSDENEAAGGGVELYIAESAAAPGLKPAVVEGSDNDKVFLSPRPFLTGKHVTSARVVQDQGRPAIEITLDDAGKQAMAKATGESLPTPDGCYKRLALVIDGKVVFAPQIHSKIAAGVARLSGHFDQQEAEALAARMTR